ncbi:3-hydroxyacyl-CoA dehydrogenase family protein [Bradyrhizobium sp. CCBAU 51627]|uniref:3-hydroxyacyl-CoA dehydrogenase family protein n=1 Tax=Bradyrhizobium sp. CCBAU 51627 TaxID=1325088 RepID=UPI00230517C6|nr:3-hydroxyacyl-CoA dehydrogenase family protein [Bradyrhizobium sp. CCBAU 51627]MDA9433838.1 3-hydroxybutyryl-CoA dehydrogenase [Bradyrhizobium sp. CCBAU 51627]
MTFKLPENIATRPIAILGAGTLGRRIALMLATRGAEVRVYARSAETRDAGVAFAKEQLPAVLATLPGSKAGTIVAVDDVTAALKNAWLVVESVPENLELKGDIFKQIDALSEPDAILASNSSSYSSSAFSDSVKNPARLLNMHFLMPPAITPVELMSCGHTNPAVIQLLVDVLPGYGLTPYVVQRESMGFIFNRIWAAIKRETLAVVAEGVASAEVVDAIYSQATGSQRGPFRLMDAVGLDVVLSIEENYAQHRLGLPEGPRILLKKMIAEGRLGIKSGRGFYDYQ